MSGDQMWNGADGAMKAPKEPPDPAVGWGNAAPPSVVQNDRVEDMSNRASHEVEHAFVTWGRLIAILGTMCLLFGIVATVVWNRQDKADDRAASLLETVHQMSEQQVALKAEVQQLNTTIVDLKNEIGEQRRQISQLNEHVLDLTRALRETSEPKR